jgi:hypothetical protein
MTSKSADLQKRQGSKITSEMRHAGNRYDRAVAPEPDRREQRARDRALGLVPYAVKLPQDLVQRLQQQAQASGIGLNELTADLLRKGLGG